MVPKLHQLVEFLWEYHHSLRQLGGLLIQIHTQIQCWHQLHEVEAACSAHIPLQQGFKYSLVDALRHLIDAALLAEQDVLLVGGQPGY